MADTFNASNKKISAQSFFGGDKVEKYRQELVAEGRIPGTKLNATAEERRQGFTLYRKNKIEFKNFVEKVLQKKTTTNYYGLTKNGNDIKRLGGTGAIVKAKPRDLTIFEKKPELSKVDKSSKNYLGEIIRLLNSILSTLQNQFKFDKKKGDSDKKEEELEKRSKRESALESVKKISSRVIDKVVAPFKSIIDRIWNFIFFTLLGRAFTKLMDWLGDPKNAQKVQVLGRFLKDWWPALLGLYFMPFKGFMVKTLGRIGWFAARFALFNPVGLAITGSAAAGIAGSYIEKKLRENDKILLQRQVSEAKQKGKPLSKKEIEEIKTKQLIKRVNLLEGPPGGALSGGGLINSDTGMKISGAGPDTQLTALQPGEIVMNRAAVKGIGADLLLSLNEKYGGSSANKPKYANNIQFAANGGMVSKGYGSNLKYKSPVIGFPNYQKPSDSYGQFFAKIYNIAKQLGDPFPEVTAAQAVEESNFGKSDLSKLANNLFGQDAPSSAPSNRKYKYVDPIEGQHTAYKFSSIEESVKYRVKTWKKYYGNAKTPAEAIHNLASAGYNPHAHYPVTIMNRLREYGVDPSIPSPLSKPKEKAKPKSWIDNLNPMNWFKNSKNKGKQGGGLVKENTGMNIFGATADRQLTALQPGEYVLPTDTVSKLGLSLIDRLVAMTDSNSSAAKIGGRKNRYVPGPLSRSGKGGMMTLPPITQSMGGGMGAPASGTSIPSFSAVSSHGAEDRSMNASIYGIVG